MVRLRRLSLLSPVSGSRHGGIVSLGAAKLRRLLSPADRGPRAMAPPPASAPPPPRVPRGGRRAVPELSCRPLGPPRGFPAATGCAPRSLPGSAGGSQAPASAAMLGARGLLPRRDLPGRAAALGAAPRGGLLAVSSGERGRAPRGVPGGVPLPRARRGATGRGPKRFPRQAPAVSTAGGGNEGGRCSGGRQTAPFPPGGASRRLGERGAAGRRRLGWREQRAPGGSGQELRRCSRDASYRDRGGSVHQGLPPVRLLWGVRLQPPRGQLLPRSRLRNLLCRLPGRGCRWGGQCSPAGHPGGRAGSR